MPQSTRCSHISAVNEDGSDVLLSANRRVALKSAIGGASLLAVPPVFAAADDEIDIKELLELKALAKNSRSIKIIDDAITKVGDMSMEEYFPGAARPASVDDAVFKALSTRGYTPKNTLLATSTCPDEVNYADGGLLDRLKKRWGETFQLGGLGGIPFAGKAGLSAYAHHVQDDGKLLIVFAPHVGISYEGKVGGLEREGIAARSSACGAAVGAFKALTAPDGKAPVALSDLDDTQIEFILIKLAPKLGNIAGSPDQLAYVTYQMYSVVREAILREIAGVPGIWDECSELSLVGGIQINRSNGDDLFQPLMFQALSKPPTGPIKVTDLFKDTFGAVPDTSRISGFKA